MLEQAGHAGQCRRSRSGGSDTVARHAFGCSEGERRRRAAGCARPGDARAAAGGRRRGRRARRGRAGGLRRRRRTRKAGAELGDPWSTDVVVKVAAPSAEEAARLHEGQVVIGFLQPLTDAAGNRAADAGRRRRARARVDSAHLARAGDGCALVPGDGRRVQGGVDRSRPAAALLPHADHRGRDDPAREGARARRRCRWPPGDRDDAPARRRGLGLRRPCGCGRAGGVARGGVSRPRRARRGDRRRLRARAHCRSSRLHSRPSCSSGSRSSMPSSRPPPCRAVRHRSSSPPRRSAGCGRAR